MKPDQKDKAAGVRSTWQRAAIIEALNVAAGFKTPQGLHSDLVCSGARVGLATVYRNLQTLAQRGEVDVLHTASGEAMYRLCKRDDHHHHLVCRRCGASFEVVAEEIESYAAAVGERHGFVELTHIIEIFGLCRKCSRDALECGKRR